MMQFVDTIQESSNPLSAKFLQPLHRSRDIQMMLMNDGCDNIMEFNSSGEL